MNLEFYPLWRPQPGPAPIISLLDQCSCLLLVLQVSTLHSLFLHSKDACEHPSQITSLLCSESSMVSLISKAQFFPTALHILSFPLPALTSPTLPSGPATWDPHCSSKTPGTHSSVSSPLHWQFPLPGALLPRTPTWLPPLLPSSLCSNTTSSVRPP
uniref:Uncharacterized protein n=1 Tax=Rousettus aegyptiacus TaxID=9407 RepID=A0A7J8BSJ3_ROUAE|nr:hypothetical protein HJG63_009579 [Rousettus aegyptiacus]